MSDPITGYPFFASSFHASKQCAWAWEGYHPVSPQPTMTANKWLQTIGALSSLIERGDMKLKRYLPDLQMLVCIKAYELYVKSRLFVDDWFFKLRAALYHLTPDYKCTDPDCPGYIDNPYWDGLKKMRNSREVSSMLRRKYDE